MTLWEAWKARRETKKRKRKEFWEKKKKQWACDHNYVTTRRVPYVTVYTNKVTGRQWEGDRETHVHYECTKCGKKKIEVE